MSWAVPRRTPRDGLTLDTGDIRVEIVVLVDSRADEHQLRELPSMHPNNALYVMRVDGTSLTKLIDTPDFKSSPEWWSP
jgi:hypothetical protein